MGVHGLWELLMPAGRRVDTSHVSRKTVAVDISIWLTQFVRAMRDAEGAMVRNAHLLGVLRRCFKLLYLGVRPVFVFDGGTPALKRRTLMIRRSIRDGQAAKLRRLAEKLLMNRLKTHALTNGVHKKSAKSNGFSEPETSPRTHKEVDTPSDRNIPPGDADMSGMERFLSSAVCASNQTAATSVPEGSGTRELFADGSGEASKFATSENVDRTQDVSHASGARDEYSDLEMEEEYGATDIELPEDPHEIDDSILVNLPPTMQAEVFKQVRIQQRSLHRERMLGTQQNPADFSQAQIAGFMKNAALNRRIVNMRNTINVQTGGTRRIASDNTREYLFEEDDIEADFGRSQEQMKPASSSHDDFSKRKMGCTAGFDESDGLESRGRYADDEDADDEDDDDDEEEEEEEEEVDILKEIRRKNERQNRRNYLLDDERNNEEVITDEIRRNTAGVAWAANVLENDGGYILGGDARDAMSVTRPSVSMAETVARLQQLQNSFGKNVDDAANDLTLDENSSCKEDIAVDKTSQQVGITPAASDSDDDLEWEDGPENERNLPSSDTVLVQTGDMNKITGCKVSGLSTEKTSRSVSTLQNTLSALRSRGSTGLDKFSAGLVDNLAESEEHKDVKISGLSAGCDSPADASAAKSQRVIVSQLRQQFLSQRDVVEANDTIEESRNCSIEKPTMSPAAGLTSERSGISDTTGRDCELNEPDQRAKQGSSPKVSIDILMSNAAVEPREHLSEPKSSGPSQCRRVGDALEDIELQNAIEASIKDFHSGCDARPSSIDTELLVDRASSDAPIDKTETASDGDLHMIREAAGCEGYLDGKCEPPIARVCTELGRKAESELNLHVQSNRTEKVGEADVRTAPDSQNADDLIAKAQEIEAGADFPQAVQLSEEEIVRLRSEIGLESASLKRQTRELQGSIESLSDEMYGETRDLLRLLGLPYMEAPMEAEAQCAYLNEAGLVDAVLTEDSDALLFGAKVVYRSLFVGGKFAESYDIACIETELGIDREQLIKLALLLGSDYTQGVRGVGIVNSMEILQAFPGENGLGEFKQWAALSSVLEEEPNVDELDVASAQAVRRRFCWKHKNMKRNWEIHESFPSTAVIDAYRRPDVDKSRLPFKWNAIDVAGLAKFCWDKFGWGAEKFNEASRPVLSQVSKFGSGQSHQTIIEDFFKPHRFARIRSERLQEAVKGLAGENAAPLLAGPRDRSRKVTGQKRKRNSVARKRPHFGDDIVEGDDDNDDNDDWDAIEIMDEPGEVIVTPSPGRFAT